MRLKHILPKLFLFWATVIFRIRPSATPLLPPEDVWENRKENPDNEEDNPRTKDQNKRKQRRVKRGIDPSVEKEHENWKCRNRYLATSPEYIWHFEEKVCEAFEVLTKYGSHARILRMVFLYLNLSSLYKTTNPRALFAPGDYVKTQCVICFTEALLLVCDSTFECLHHIRIPMHHSDCTYNQSNYNERT